MNKIKFTLLIAGLALAQGALAQGFYLGGSLGKAQAKDGCMNAAFACNAQDPSWSAFAGYMFDAKWGLEGGYRNLGRISDQNDGMGNTAYVKSRVFDVAGVGVLQIEKLSVYGKAGVYHAKSTLTSTFLPEGSRTNRQFTYALGVGWNFTRHLTARLEWQRYNNLGGGAIGFISDVEATSLAGVFRF